MSLFESLLKPACARLTDSLILGQFVSVTHWSVLMCTSDGFPSIAEKHICEIRSDYVRFLHRWWIFKAERVDWRNHSSSEKDSLIHRLLTRISSLIWGRFIFILQYFEVCEENIILKSVFRWLFVFIDVLSVWLFSKSRI